MATLRNRFFIEGIVLGGLCGVVLGSLIAFQIGGERVNEARRLGRPCRAPSAAIGRLHLAATVV